MIRRDFHSLHEIKTVRIKPLHTGIKLEMFATVFSCLPKEPIKKFPSMSGRTIGLASHEIIHIKKSPRKQRFQNAITGDGADLALRFQIGQQIAVASLALDAFNKFLRSSKLRSQFTHHFMTTRDL